MYEARKKIYDVLVALNPRIARKGKTMPYTSVNGYMFSQLNKAGEIGIRLSDEDKKTFEDTHGASPFTSYGATMQGYVTLPESMLDDLTDAAALLSKAHDHFASLPPNKGKKK